MICRPQFPFSTPDQFQDKDFVHCFDQTTTAQLNNALSLAVGNSILGIPLVLEADAPFTWRGVKINIAGGTATFSVKFRDPYGNYLSDDFIPTNLKDAALQTTVYGSNVVELEPQISCPRGSQILVDVKRVS